MIKGITLVRAVASADTFDKLTSLLAALGFEPGKGWNDAQGQGRGAAFLAPIGNLELVTGRLPAVPPVLIEVTQLDAIHAAVQKWMLASYRTEEIAALLSTPAPTHWNSPPLHRQARHRRSATTSPSASGSPKTRSTTSP